MSEVTMLEQGTPIETYREYLKDIYNPPYTFQVLTDGRGDRYLQGSYMEEDIYTGAKEVQLTRRWFISPFQTKSEFVQTVFKCVITSMEHRVREHFLYQNERVFSPHHNVDALVKLCKETERDHRAE